MTASWTDRLAVFDLETTGIDTSTARIVTAAVIRLDSDGQPILDHGVPGVTAPGRTWLVDPGVAIPDQAAAVHGITTAHARAHGADAASAIAEIVAELREVLRSGYAVVAYNAPFDLTILANEAVRHGIEPIAAPRPVIDPLVIDKQVDRYRKGKRRLELVATHYGVDISKAHDAAADAIAAGQVAHAIARQHADKLPRTLGELHDAQVAWAAEQDADFSAYMRRSVNPDFVSTRGTWPIDDLS